MFIKFFILIFLILTSSLLADGGLAVNVIKVIDGDSVKVVYVHYDQLKMNLRLAHIDAPERGQPFYKESKSFLKNLILNRTVEIQLVGIGKYGRRIAIIYNNGINVNKLLVLKGLAWWNYKYSNDLSYKTLQKRNERLNIGIWSVDNPIEPWRWRKGFRR